MVQVERPPWSGCKELEAGKNAPASAGRRTLGHGSPSHCSPTRTRIRSDRSSWRTRCRARVASIFPVMARIDARVKQRAVNGQPGGILRDRDGKVVGTLTLDVLGGQIQTIRAVVNPTSSGTGVRQRTLGEGDAGSPPQRHAEARGA